MIYIATLVLHIVVACATIGVLVAAAAALVRQKHGWYMRLGTALAALAALECATGVALVALSPDISIVKTGVHLALYLGACLLAEAALAAKMQRVWIG